MSCNKEMIKIIEVLNKLQDKLVSLGVNDLVKELPQIAVVGSQSAGKSSVLESFVGRDFLPRGGDIVTRRPLILQLKQNTDDSRTYAKFNHSTKEYTDFDEIRQEIQAETERTVPDYAISSDPIKLIITSPDVLDLNLIDLPGMTKVPVGKQPENIEDMVKSLIIEYISKENCLILAVTPANQDLSTSDAIKLSREVDPFGNRTIGVLTKLDLMDKGTDAQIILKNEHKIKLKRGFIGVICRSPKDIENNKELREAIADEKNFFAEHPAYRDIRQRLGIEYLQKYLQNELADHLFTELPTLRKRFRDNLNYLNDRIEKISLPITEMTSNELIANTAKDFSQCFCNEIGTGDDVPIDRRNCGVNINVEMNVKYAEALEAIVLDKKRIQREIGLAIINIFGTRIELFVPNKAFSLVVRKQLDHMRDPSLECVDAVYCELESIVKNSAKVISGFPKLVDLYTNTTLEFLRECKKKCREMVDHYSQTEKAYLSANHADFIESIKAEKTLQMTNLMVKSLPEKSDWITYNGYKYLFSIENRNLAWYSDQYRNSRYGSIDLNDYKQSIIAEKCLLLIKGNSEMKLEFESKERLLEWVCAIMNKAYDSDVNPENTMKATVEVVVDNDMDPASDKYPISIGSQVEVVKKLVLAYLKTIELKLKDYVPKLCQKELIDATEQFIGETLRNRIQSKGFTIGDLVDRDPHEEERKNLLKRQTLYEDALQAMNDVTKSSVVSVKV